jgi:tight adherence protein B
MSHDAIIGAGVAFVAVAMATISLALFWEWMRAQRRESALRRQLATVKNAGTPAKDEDSLFRGGGRTGPLEPLVSLARQFGNTSAVEAMLVEAGMKWDLGTFLLVSIGCALGLGLAGLILTQLLIVGLALASFGALLPYLYVSRRRQRRLNAFEEGLPEALDLLGRAIRAGHPISSGIKIVADETGEPVAGEFQRCFEEQRFGLPFEDSLLALSIRVPLMDLRMLVTAILIQREVGGNLAEVLDNLADVIRQRFTVRRQLRTYTAQGRLSGYILAVLPIAVASLIFLINPPYIKLLFQHPLGKLMLGIAASMQLFGFFWIRRIVDIEI